MGVWRLAAEGLTSREAFARQFRLSRVSFADIEKRRTQTLSSTPAASPVTESSWTENGEASLKEASLGDGFFFPGLARAAAILLPNTSQRPSFPFFFSAKQIIRTEAALMCAANALRRPTEDFHVATLSEFTSERQLRAMRKEML